MAEHEAGLPSWVDLASPDVEASKAFYGGLFGWTSDESPEPEAGGYSTFYLEDKAVAGVKPRRKDATQVQSPAATPKRLSPVSASEPVDRQSSQTLPHHRNPRTTNAVSCRRATKPWPSSSSGSIAPSRSFLPSTNR